jgi:hypothetical protein
MSGEYYMLLFDPLVNEPLVEIPCEKSYAMSVVAPCGWYREPVFTRNERSRIIFQGSLQTPPESKCMSRIFLFAIFTDKTVQCTLTRNSQQVVIQCVAFRLLLYDLCSKAHTHVGPSSWKLSASSRAPEAHVYNPS